MGLKCFRAERFTIALRTDPIAIEYRLRPGTEAPAVSGRVHITGIGDTEMTNFVTKSRDEVAQGVIMLLLSQENFEWRSGYRLAAAAGVSEAELPKLIAKVCARQDHNRQDLFGLVARVGA